MSSPTDSKTIEFRGILYVWCDEMLFAYDANIGIWVACPDKPEGLLITGDGLSVAPGCCCPSNTLFNFGCKCGGV